MGSAASCFSSSPPISNPKNHHVFISFRGDDTRTNFTSHLYTALSQNSIKTYIDYDLPKGDHISDSIFQAIRDSCISVVVFSENFGFSKWCLDELTHILKCRKEEGQFLIPVFYKVDPSDIRKQNGTYKDAFAKHERDFIHNHHKVKEWRDSLFQASNLAGWDSRFFRDESELIRNIVNDVLQKLDYGHPSALKGFVGIHENCECIELLLEKAQIVGIWGMGGIGKTTIAKAVFSKLSPQYESCCFLENVREESEKHGLKHVRDNLVLELFKEENILNNSQRVLGSTAVSRRLSCRKVLIVLDDVNSSKQLEYLAQECNFLRKDSRVIITTRDKHLLVGRVDEIHEVMELKYQESYRLFNLKAFHNNHPDNGFEQLSQRAVDYAKGVPLALIVLGSFLHSKTKEEWDSALTKLKKTPNDDIQKVLKLSYDGLNYEEKEIFLDIACFLKGNDKEHVIRLLDSYGFHPTIGIRALVDKALITMGDKVWMHDLIQEMGWEIIRQECIKEPGRRSRLWDPKEVYDVLKHNMGTTCVEGIMLNMSQIRDLHLNADTFKNMGSIRFLKLYSSWNSGPCNVHLPSGLESFSDKIRYFEWHGYPLKSLPSNFCAEKLVELKMQNSLIQTLWEGVQDFVNLKRLNLSRCKHLRELPNFSKAQNLEIVNLSYCHRLRYVHPSILSLQALVILNLDRCYNLQSLQSESHLKSLKRVKLNRSYNLKEFSLSSEELTDLILSTTGIEILHSSIGRLTKLRSLHLNGSGLKNVPIKELCRLKSLEVLRIYDHMIDKPYLHMLFDSLFNIRELRFLYCGNLTELPSNMNQLSRLQKLSLRGCRNLQCLPELPSSVEELDIAHCMLLSISCSSLKGFSVLSTEVGASDQALYSSSIGYLTNLRRLHLSGSSLENISITELCCFRSLVQLHLHKCEQVLDKANLQILLDALRSLELLDLQKCCNLSELPSNVSHLSRLRYLYLKGCTRLRSLPKLPRFIRELITSNCTSLETMSISTISRLLHKHTTKLSFENCVKLDKPSLCAIMKVAQFLLKRGVYNSQPVLVRYPGNSVPLWFREYQTTKASVTIQLSLASDNILGFILCSVLPQFMSMENFQAYVFCQCSFEDGEVINYPIMWSSYENLNSDHILLCCNPIFSDLILKRLRGRYDEANIHMQKVLFKFKFHNRFINKCGVCPIYASQHHGYVPQMKLASNLKVKLCTKRKRCQYVVGLELENSENDEKKALPPCKKLKVDLHTQSTRHVEDIDELETLFLRINIS